MSSEPNNRAPIDAPPSPPPGEAPYRTYRARGGATGPAERPYRKYRSVPRGLRARLSGEEDIDPGYGRGAGAGGPPGRGTWSAARGPGARSWWRRRLTPWRVLAYLVAAVVAWLALSFVLFVISAERESGSIPKPALAALSPAGNMLTSTDTVLVLGTDQRPHGTHEAGANTSDKGSRSDTIMLWRIGGGTSRRLSIPRDTLTTIPGFGHQKINAAYAIGGPALAIKTIEAFTGVKINHLIIVNLANFPKFIDAIGGITVHTGRICSNISGGARNGGFTLDLRPGTHHLDGIQALTLARTRENACDAASNDLTREGYQQQILNGIKSKLLSPSAFFHLPWASWYAPQAVRTDMGPLTLMSLFVASELGGSAPTRILKPSGGEYVPGVGDSLIASPSDVRRAVSRLMNG